jgi:TrmH family RNA methyltransferase
MKRISSRENAAWKSLARLCHSGRERRKQDRCVLEGAHTIRAYIERFGNPEHLIVDASTLADNREHADLVAAVAPAIVIAADHALFDELAQTAAPTGIVAVARVPKPRSTIPETFGLLLEDIQDPGNVGAILRVAAGAGISHVLLTRNCAFAWSPKVLRAAQGAHFYVDIVENVEVASVAAEFRGRLVAALPRGGTSLFDADLRGPLLLLIGNEGAGLSETAVAAATLRVRIPMPGRFESLNAATAAAICVFEKVRQDSRSAQ